MPIYEFFCPDNNRIYSFLARSLAYSAVIPRCPENPRFRMERMFSTFSVTGRATEEPPDAPGNAHDPDLERAMSAMEREFSKMDMDNPDPRQLAQMFRTMTSISGEKMPEQMEEVMRRMEAGESMEALEEEMANVGDFGESEEGGAGVEALKEKLRAARSRPLRDPVLYDIGEYAHLPASSDRKKTGRRRAGK